MNPNTPTRPARIGALVALAAVFGAGAVGVAGADGTEQQTPPGATDRPLATAVQPDQAAGFALFARARVARDEMPLGAKEQVGNSTRSGRNVDLSRAISTPTGTGWAVPGNGTVCLVVPDPVDGYGITCTETEHALKHGLVAMLIRPEKPGLAYVTMISPRKSSVTATLPDGRAQVLEPDADGVVNAALAGQTEISVRTSSGSRRIGTPVAPPTKPTAKDCGDGRVIDAEVACPNS